MVDICSVERADIIFNFKHKSFIVAGASSGIGAQVARMLRDNGASLLLLGRRAESQLPESVINLLADDVVYCPIDFMSDNFQIELLNVFKNFVDKVGVFSGLVHTTGCHHFGPLSTIKQSDIDKIMRINVGSVFSLLKIFMKKKFRTENSSVVLLSSTSGFVGESCTSLYALSKASISSITKSLAAELLKKNIRVNCVVPAIVEDGMSAQLFASLEDDQVNMLRAAHPMGFGKSLDVGYSVEFLLSSAAKWINGSSLICDGGYLNIK